MLLKHLRTSKNKEDKELIKWTPRISIENIFRTLLNGSIMNVVFFLSKSTSMQITQSFGNLEKAFSDKKKNKTFAIR